ncbi:unnamed protein product [Amoebophrya sp. A25]|nr:unnamed protein product [Amoebophrya sp. A25]|eukprot:GSA25T00026300001.1
MDYDGLDRILTTASTVSIVTASTVSTTAPCSTATVTASTAASPSFDSDNFHTRELTSLRIRRRRQGYERSRPRAACGRTSRSNGSIGGYRFATSSSSTGRQRKEVRFRRDYQRKSGSSPSELSSRRWMIRVAFVGVISEWRVGAATLWTSAGVYSANAYRRRSLSVQMRTSRGEGPTLKLMLSKTFLLVRGSSWSPPWPRSLYPE